MPENTENTQVETQENSSTEAGSTSFEPITSQEGLDRIVQARLARERSKYADYDELREKAAKFDETVEANKTELEKAVERASTAEAQLLEATARSEKLGIVAEFQIPTEYQELLTATDPEGLRAQAEKIQNLLKPRNGVVPNEGKEPTGRVGSGDPLRDAFRNL